MQATGCVLQGWAALLPQALSTAHCMLSEGDRLLLPYPWTIQLVLPASGESTQPVSTSKNVLSPALPAIYPKWQVRAGCWLGSTSQLLRWQAVADVLLARTDSLRIESAEVACKAAGRRVPLPCTQPGVWEQITNQRHHLKHDFQGLTWR